MPRPAKKSSTVNRSTSLKATKASAAKSKSSSSKSSAPKLAKPSTLNKQSQIIELLQRPSGAQLADLMEATGWQAHSIRGVISGILRKKLGLTVVSESDANGTRVYRINSSAGAGR